jgi:hypothetical protein
VITYPICSGSSAADLNLGVILTIEDIIPNNPSYHKDFNGHTERDRKKAYASPRRIAGRWQPDPNSKLPHGGDFQRDDSKAFICTVRRVWEGYGGWRIWRPEYALRKVSVKNVDRIVVVTDKIDQRTRERAECLFRGELPAGLNEVV